MYSIRRLVEAAQGRGHEVRVLDVLRSNHGPVVMEVSSSPGLEGIEGATGQEIAGIFVAFIEKSAAIGKPKTRSRG